MKFASAFQTPATAGPMFGSPVQGEFHPYSPMMTPELK